MDVPMRGVVARRKTFSRQGAEAQRPPSTLPVLRPLRPASRSGPVVGGRARTRLRAERPAELLVFAYACDHPPRVARRSGRTAQRLFHLSSRATWEATPIRVIRVISGIFP